MDIEEQYDKIYRYCYFKLYDTQLAQDITQETFLRFYRQGLTLDNDKELPYLYTIAKNLCIDHFRKRTVESLEEITEEVPSLQKTPYKRRFGDRKDGRLIRSMDPLAAVAPFIMSTRTGSQNLFKDFVDIENINKFVHKKRSEGFTGFGTMHVFIAAYIRMLSQRPALNRFISGQRIYARNNIEIIMAVKKEMTLESPETMVKFFFEPSSTVFDVYNQFNEKILAIKDAVEEDTSFDALAGLLGKIPRFALRWTIKFLNWLDYHGWLPTTLTELSPFHGALVVTSMASLGISPVYHHLYEFGNVPMFMAFSGTRHENIVDRNGNVKNTRFFDFSVSSDERICDGFYFASALKELKKYLTNPELLENPPEKIIEDIP